MSTVRALGDWKMAWPEGVDSAWDLPHTFVDQWTFALVVLNWRENMPKEDQPPRRIWNNAEALESHFAYITKKRSSGYEEAPDGTLEDARHGKSVTLRNSLVEMWQSSHQNEDPNYTRI